MHIIICCSAARQSLIALSAGSLLTELSNTRAGTSHRNAMDVVCRMRTFRPDLYALLSEHQHSLGSIMAATYSHTRTHTHTTSISCSLTGTFHLKSSTA
jgi:hypothetical protein